MRPKTPRLVATYALMAAGGTAVAWIVGGAGARWQGVPVLAVCAMLAFAINWAAAIPAILRQTEHYYDLVGALTYASVVLTALTLTGRRDAAALIVAAMVLVWCIRLGGSLFLRVKATGQDKRFRILKTRPLPFFGAWTTQGLWVVLTSLAALAILVLPPAPAAGPLWWIGAAMWAAGFAIEVVADAQKTRFRNDPANRGRFITGGLWAWSQHPNYFGEILLWAGIAVMAVPVLSGGAWLALVSPVFVYVLLTRVSGIPLLDLQAAQRWGDDPAYAAHVARTSKLVPLPPR